MLLSHALKEWSAAVDGLTQGETSILLRKGGIRERRFQVPHRQVWLYPTYEHQQPHLLKERWAKQVQPVPSGWHPEAVTIKAWAAITHIYAVTHLPAIEALLPFHIWQPTFVSERLRWKSGQPLLVLLLRTYRLEHPFTLPWRDSYGGCRSWIELEPPYPTLPSRPVLSDREHQSLTARLQPLLDQQRSQC